MKLELHMNQARPTKCLFVALLLVCAAASPARADARLGLKSSMFRLPNGLRVVVQEDHHTPYVGLEVWYDVGSHNDPVGRSGLAHLFEHLMFSGTLHTSPGERMRTYASAGGWTDATTDFCRTRYYGLISANALDRALWLEAESLRFLLPALDSAKLEKEKAVVLNERRQRYENNPPGRAELRHNELLFPTGHPYHRPIIGEPAEIASITLDDARRFYRSYYGPDHAVIAIAGDTDAATVRRLVERYFGDIPPLAPVQSSPASLTPLQHTAVDRDDGVVTVQDGVSTPHVRYGWALPSDSDADYVRLELLGHILTDQSGRLTRRLIDDSHLATQVQVEHRTYKLVSTFTLDVSLAAGASVAAVLSAIAEELDRLKRDPARLEELTRAANLEQSSEVFALLSLAGGYDSRAFTLARNLFFFGRTDAMLLPSLPSGSVAAAGVQAAVNRLAGSKAAVIVVEPAKAPQ